jgi:multidrug efflux pump subunit AcrA (membrane-fusion protein)
MSEGLGAIVDAAPWAPLALAFLVGLACGWLLWGLRGADAAGAAPVADKSSGDEGDERKEIVVLRAELEAARALLNDSDALDEELEQQLSALDEALKRANGRLKVLLSSVKR